MSASVAASALASVSLGTVPAAAFWIITAVFAFLLRDARHRVPSKPLAVVCPANGTLIDIDHVSDPWLDRAAVRLRLRMAGLGPYSLFSPSEGKIVEQWAGHCTGMHVPGTDSVCQSLWIRTDEGDDVVLVLHPRWKSARNWCHIGTGERIGQGQRCGYLFTGGFIDVLMPQGTRIDVTRGQVLEAGSGIIATLLHRSGSSRESRPATAKFI